VLRNEIFCSRLEGSKITYGATMPYRVNMHLEVDLFFVIIPCFSLETLTCKTNRLRVIHSNIQKINTKRSFSFDTDSNRKAWIKAVQYTLIKVIHKSIHNNEAFLQLPNSSASVRSYLNSHFKFITQLMLNCTLPRRLVGCYQNQVDPSVLLWKLLDTICCIFVEKCC
jgi:hypothetical protein